MERILEQVFGFQTTQVILTAVELGIFSEIHRRAEDASGKAENVAKTLKLDFNATERLLNACVSLELVSKSSDGVYSLTADVAKYLTDDSCESLVRFVKRMRDQYTDLAKLATAVKHGQAAACPEDMATDGQVEELKLLYNADMIQIAGSRLVRAFDLSQYRTACDLAGGTGGMGRCLKQAYPEMTVSVLEQESIVQYAREHEDGPENISFLAGDAMSEDLPASDLYMVGHLCMYLDDKALGHLFSNIFANLPSGGGLLLCESLLSDDRTGPLLTLHRDVAELVVAPQGERNRQQYTCLLNRAGFRDIHTRMFENHICYDVILAQKA